MSLRLRPDDRPLLLSLRRYLVERVVAFVVVLWLALSLVFVLFHVVPKRCVVSQNEDRYTELARHRYCDGPVYERYWRFMSQLGHGSFGYSGFMRRDVTGPVLDSARVSMSVVGGALVFAALVGFGVAMLSGLGRAARASGRWFSYLAFGLHPLWLALLLAYWVGWRWGLTPVTGYCDLFAPPPGGCGGAAEWAWHLVLPWITIGLGFAAMYAQLISSLLKRSRARIERADPYARPAVRRRMRRQSIVAFTKRLGHDFGIALGVSWLIESIYSLPGLGRTLIQSLNNYDPPTTQAVVAGAVILAFTFDFLVNLVGGLVEPEWRTR